MDQQEYDFADSESIANLGLRFLSPTEVARLHVFPLSEEYPADSPFIIEDTNSSATTCAQDTLTSIRAFNPRLAQCAEAPFLKFPEKLKAIQRYKLLGNSLNVWVVAELLRGVLFADHPGSPLPVYTAINETTEEAGEIPTSQKHSIDEGSQDSKESSEEKDRGSKRVKADS